MRKELNLVLLAVFFLTSLLRAAPVQAAEFNADYIISDYELEDYAALSQDAIQRFLESKKSGLAAFSALVGNERKSASKIIYEQAILYEISPKFILAMLQKEQSLLSDSSPSQDQLDWAAGFGVCDSCSKTDPALAPLKGFYNQVSGLAEKVRANYWRDLKALGRTFTGWGPGRTKTTLDGFAVTPANNATAVLYTYNPYRGGVAGHGANHNFWKIWHRYFVLNYPDGTLLQEKGQSPVWLLQNGKKRVFATRAALYSRHNPSRIIQVSKNEIDKYEAGAPIKFPNYSLLQAPWGTIYLLADDAIRGIKSKEVFRSIGFNPEEVIKVSAPDLKLYREIEPITLADAYPTGGLLQNKNTGAVYYVQNGARRGIIDRAILKINFKNYKIISARPEQIDQYPDAGPLALSTGSLVTGGADRAVYFIENGKRRPIVSAEAFEKLGFKWQDVIAVPNKVIALHPLGISLDLVAATDGEEVLGENVH